MKKLLNILYGVAIFDTITMTFHGLLKALLVIYLLAYTCYLSNKIVEN